MGSRVAYDRLGDTDNKDVPYHDQANAILTVRLPLRTRIDMLGAETTPSSEDEEEMNECGDPAPSSTDGGEEDGPRAPQHAVAQLLEVGA